MEGWRVENCVTMICTTTLVIWLFSMSGSWVSFWGLILLLNMNAPKSQREN